MSEIKSKKAKEYIAYHCIDINAIYPLTNDQVEEVIIIAETELTEAYTKDLQSVHDMYKQMFIEHYREYESDKTKELQEVKDKAVEAFCKAVCPNGIRCAKSSTPYNCKRSFRFITELNK